MFRIGAKASSRQSLPSSASPVDADRELGGGAGGGCPDLELELERDPLGLEPLLLEGFDKSLIPAAAAVRLWVNRPSVISDSWVVNFVHDVFGLGDPSDCLGQSFGKSAFSFSYKANPVSSETGGSEEDEEEAL